MSDQYFEISEEEKITRAANIFQDECFHEGLLEIYYRIGGDDDLLDKLRHFKRGAYDKAVKELEDELRERGV